MSRRRHRAEPTAKVASDLPAWLAIVVLALAVGVTYVATPDAPFIFDDTLSIEENPSIVRLWPLYGDDQHPGPLRPPTEFPVSARPLVNLTFAVNYHFGRLEPRGYRAVNIALHFLSALLLWAIVNRTLRLPSFGGKYDRVAGVLALAVALLWSVHPLLTEAVVYVTQRTELMVALFYLATLYSSLRYWGAARPRSRRAWLALATLAGLAGAASKEVMATAPVVMFLFEWTFMRGSVREIVRRSWPLYLGLGASWLLLAVLQADAPRSESAGFSLGLPLLDWWSTQVQVFLMYLKLAVYPWPLVVHYELPVQPLSVNWAYVLAAAAFGVAALVLLGRRHPAGFLMATVMLVLAPTHLVPIPTEMAAERRMYLPLAALVALAVVGVYALIARISSPPLRGGSPLANRKTLLVLSAAAAILLALFYSLASINRLALYHEPVKLWQDAAEWQPMNPVTQLNLAVSLSEARRLEEAIEHYQEAIRFKPDSAQAHYGLGLALAHLGRLDESVEHLHEVVRLKPQAYRLRNNLGVVLFTAGRYPEAIAEFEKTLALEPGFVEAQENLNRARQASVLPKEPE